MNREMLRRDLLEFFQQQRDFVMEMSSEEVAPYLDRDIAALLIEMASVLDRCRAACARRDVTLREMKDAFYALKTCIDRADGMVVPWIRSMRMPN